MTPGQARAARALLKMGVREVAERAMAMPGVNPNRIVVILVRPDPPEW